MFKFIIFLLFAATTIFGSTAYSASLHEVDQESKVEEIIPWKQDLNPNNWYLIREPDGEEVVLLLKRAWTSKDSGIKGIQHESVSVARITHCKTGSRKRFEVISWFLGAKEGKREGCDGTESLTDITFALQKELEPLPKIIDRLLQMYKAAEANQLFL